MKNIKFITLFGACLISSVAFAESITYSVNGITKAISYGPAETVVKSLTTGNHHCDSDCRGEPTRTPYRIDYRVDVNQYEITDAKLTCTGGPCAYSQVKSVSHTKNTAYGAFDVWTRPTNWTLTITQKKKNQTNGDIVQIDSDEIQPGKAFIVNHDASKYLDVELEAKMPFGVIKMNPKKPLKKYFELLGQSKFGDTIKYTILYKGI